MRADIVCGLASNPTGGMDQRQPGFLFPQSEWDACIAMLAVRESGFIFDPFNEIHPFVQPNGINMHENHSVIQSRRPRLGDPVV